MAPSSEKSEVRPLFRFLAGVLAAFGAIAVLIAVVSIAATGEWWPLSVIVGALPAVYSGWRIARVGRL